jgi:hypothetical protein
MDTATAYIPFLPFIYLSVEVHHGRLWASCVIYRSHVVVPCPCVTSSSICEGCPSHWLQGYKPPDEPASEYQTIPLNKIEDFGVHCKSYYSVDITFFKSTMDAQMLDLLWNKYWVNTLSSSPLVTTRDLAAGQISDIGAWRARLAAEGELAPAFTTWVAPLHTHFPCPPLPSRWPVLIGTAKPLNHSRKGVDANPRQEWGAFCRMMAFGCLRL